MESFDLNCQKFKESLKENMLHNISGADVPCNLKFEEPHYLLSTSGSFKKKHYIHSLTGIQKACESLNLRHPMNSSDRWWLSLPAHHVSGFSILARSHFLNLKPPLEQKFEFSNLAQTLLDEKITVLSLVPTQVFDVVSRKLKAPKSVKYVFVGGAKLSQKLFQEAKSLEWPLVVCYGSTETFAQMASSDDNKHYTPYSGWSVEFSKEETVKISGPSVYEFKYDESDLCFKKSNKVFLGSDTGLCLKNNQFVLNSRADTKYKSKGLFYDFEEQKQKIESLLLDLNRPLAHYIPVVLEEERAGARLYLICSQSEIQSSEQLMKDFKDIQGVYFVKDLNLLKSSIGKPLKSKIQDVLLRPVLSV